MRRFDDEVPMGRDTARSLLDLANELWSTPLSHDERQEWGKMLTELDPDYAVVTFSAMKICSPSKRPTTQNFIDCYSGVIEEAHGPGLMSQFPVERIEPDRSNRFFDTPEQREHALSAVAAIKEANGYSTPVDDSYAVAG